MLTIFDSWSVRVCVTNKYNFFCTVAGLLKVDIATPPKVEGKFRVQRKKIASMTYVLVLTDVSLVVPMTFNLSISTVLEVLFMSPEIWHSENETDVSR